MLGTMDLATVLTLLTGLAVGLGLGALVGLLWGRLRSTSDDAPVLEQRAMEQRVLEQGAADRAVVQEGLARLGDQLRDLAHERAAWQGQLHAQVEHMRHTTDDLRRETRSLATALRKPQVRGRWGELHLRRAVELAGLVDRCDFSEQVRLDDGAQRPDLVVHLAGGRSVVVDAKVPLDAFLDATSAEDDEARDAHLRRHARQLRTHADALASKRYWRSLPGTPEFVVLFVPAESFLSAALEADGSLLEHAADQRVVLATPTTLIALLRTVAQGWTHEALADRAREIHELGRELHERLGTLGGHVDRLGRALGSAVASYNSAVGSLEGRVLVTARRFTELGLSAGDLGSPRQLEVSARSLAADELTGGGGGVVEPGVTDDFAALGDLATPYADQTSTTDPPEPDAPPARRARGA